MAKTANELPVALTIAGVDSGGGAGIAADLKTFAAIGVHGTLAVTSVTAQNTLGVQGIHDIPPQMVELQVEAIAEDMGIDAAKTGMLSNRGIIRSVAKVVEKYGFPLVVDPVMYAKSGDKLLRDDAIEDLKNRLLPLALIATPNRFEAEHLAEMEIRNLDDASLAAKKISRSYNVDIVVVKGGHLEGSYSIDTIYNSEKDEVIRLTSQKVSGCTHGTGCSFSAAIAGYIALGRDPIEAIKLAKNFITKAIERSYRVGKGHCPVNPMAELAIDAEKYRAQNMLYKSVRELENIDDFAALIPEIQVNFVYSIPRYLAKGIEDVVAVPGRIINFMGKPKASGYPVSGASSHVARGVLKAMEFYPDMRSAINIRYSSNIEAIIKKLRFQYYIYDRRIEEPEEVKKQEGMSIPWKVKTAFEKSGSRLDAIIDLGDYGKEPTVTIYGRDPEDVLNKVKKIIEEIKKT